MDAFSSGSELSSADELSGNEAPRSEAPEDKELAKRAAPAPVPIAKRAKIAPGADEAPAPKPARPSALPARLAPPKDESTDPQRQGRSTPKPADGPAFGRNMSGWDQLFGPIASTPKTETRAKDQTPEQRAAQAEAHAKEREIELRERNAREKARQAQEAKDKQARDAEAAAREAARVAARPPPPPPPRRPQSITAEELDAHRARLRAAWDGAGRHLDLLASCRLIGAFEEDMGHERRHLRASRFAAGLHHLGESKAREAKPKEGKPDSVSRP